MKGKIISVIAGVYQVYLENKEIISIKPRGKLRHLNVKLCVGDEVEVINNVIEKAYPRKNVLIRPNIASLDIGIIVCSLKEPDFSSFLLDKFLTYLNMYNIDPIIVLSKADLISEEKIEVIKKDYLDLNIPIFVTNKYNPSIDELKALIKGKTVAFIGQTGVGKSSLMNLINPSFERKVGEYSKFLNRGKHQTKEVIIYPFEDSFVADTPGFSSLELTCYKEELMDYFPFFENREKCFYQDCRHINEPKCVIIDLVKKGIIKEEHYQNYLLLEKELIFRKDRFK